MIIWVGSFKETQAGFVRRRRGFTNLFKFDNAICSTVKLEHYTVEKKGMTDTKTEKKATEPQRHRC